MNGAPGAKAADQQKNAGEMGAGASQAESPGGSAGCASAAVSRHAGAAGEGGSRLKRWECEEQESKTPHAKPAYGAPPLLPSRNIQATRRPGKREARTLDRE